jgi:hypothetical protein
LIPGRGKIFLFFAVFRLALGCTQPPIQWVQEALSLGIKGQGCEADHTPPSSAKVKNGGAILPLPHTSSRHSAEYSSINSTVGANGKLSCVFVF